MQGVAVSWGGQENLHDWPHKNVIVSKASGGEPRYLQVQRLVTAQCGDGQLVPARHQVEDIVAGVGRPGLKQTGRCPHGRSPGRKGDMNSLEKVNSKIPCWI